MKITYLIFLLLLLINCSCQKARHHLTVHFQIDKKNINIKNAYNVDILQKGDTLKANIDGDYLELPELSNDAATLIFTYQKYKLEFKDVEVEKLRLNQNMDWKFKVLTSNFSNMVNTLNLGQVTGIQVWEINPLEHGDGIDITVPVYK